MPKEQRLIFDEVPELYDRNRPSYPDALFDDLVSLSGILPEGRILEIGCGTGQATIPLAQRGFSVICLEPGPSMARFAQAKLARFPRVQVLQTTFEEWPVERGAFGLVFSAQAFGWVEADVRFTKAALALDASGSLAVVGNAVVRERSNLREAIDAVYARHAPSLAGLAAMRWYSEEGPIPELFSASGCFGPVTWRRYPWFQVYSRSEYCDLLRTHSDHRMLPADRLECLLKALSDLIEAHGSGIEVAYDAHLYLASRGRPRSFISFKRLRLKPADKMFGSFKVREILLKAIRVSNRCGKALQVRGWGRYLMGRMIVDLLLWPSDSLAVRRQYASFFDRPPKLLRPKTFNEKIQRNKLFRRRSRYTLFADKIAVRDYVKRRVGSHVLSKLYWTGTDLRTVSSGILPKKFVIKANHASGRILIVNDRDAFNWKQAYEQTCRWLEQDYSEMWAEWQYRWIEPRLLIEEFLEVENGRSPPDYKFFCFRGRVEMVEIDFDRFLNHTRAFVGRNFEVLQFGIAYGRYPGALVPPANFSTMIGIAEALAGRESFIRVDLYDVGRPIFGELTLHPKAGLGTFEPPEYDLIVGKLMP
jgi:Trans-aconitate methyltransferase